MRLKIPNIKKYWTSGLRHTEIASLELEFHRVMSNPTYNTARAGEILSALAKLYQAELNEREDTACEGAHPSPPSVTNLTEPESRESRKIEDSNSPLVSQCQSVIDEAKQSMARAQGGSEIRAAFRKGVQELMDTLDKDSEVSP